MADGSYIMHTAKIAPKLEELYPEPSLHLGLPTNDEAGEIADMLTMFFAPGLMPSILDLLQEPSKSWFIIDRERRLGMSLDEMTQKLGGEQMWEKAEPYLEKLKKLLESNKKDEGPFILGNKPSLGDLLIVALFEGYRKLASDDRLVTYDASFQKLNEACKQWTKKDD